MSRRRDRRPSAPSSSDSSPSICASGDLTSPALNPAVIDLIAGHFKVLAEPARLTLLQALRSGERSVSALVDATGMSQANVSKHLQALLAGGFVERRKEGVFVYYAITNPDILRVCDLMCQQLEFELNRRRRFLGAWDSTG